MRLVLLDTIVLLDKLDDIRESRLKRALHGLGQSHGRHQETVGRLTGACLLRDVAIGHHQNHRLGLALSDEVVHNLCGTAQLAPRILVATDAVQQVEDGIVLLAGFVARRGIDGQTTRQSGGRALIPHLADGAMRHLVDLIEVCTLVATNEQQAEEVVDVADVVDIQRVNDFDAVDQHVVGVELGLQLVGGKAPHALLVLDEVSDTRCLVGVALIAHRLRRQKVASDLYLLSLGGYQIESYGVVSVNIGRCHLRSLAPVQVLLGLYCRAHQAEDSHHHLFFHCRLS